MYQQQARKRQQFLNMYTNETKIRKKSNIAKCNNNNNIMV